MAIPTTKLPTALHDEFLTFLETHPPQDFSNSLRRMLLDYMRAQVQTGLPLHFDQFLWSLSDLFDLLESAAQQLNKANPRCVPAPQNAVALMRRKKQ